MIIRPYEKYDFKEVQALHQSQGYSYALPNLDKMLVKAVIEEHGKITHSLFLRATTEAYWIFDPAQSKRERLGRLLALSNELVNPAKRAGIEDVHAFLPPEIVTTSLHRTLLRLGWEKPLWVCYSRKVSA